MRAVGVAAFALLATACQSPPAQAPRSTLAGPRGAPHMQVIRALPTAGRAELVQRFRERNGAWKVTLSATGTPDDIDPIRGVIRRATREGPPAEGPELDEAVAISAAQSFLVKNADFLGFKSDDVAALDLMARRAQTKQWGAWVVQARGKSLMRGYEGFDAVTTQIDVLVYLGDDAAARYFVNLSQVHPRLAIDTKPLLGPDDAKLLVNVVGRPVFVVVDDPDRPNARVRELRRVQLGMVERRDVRGLRLTIDVSPGPFFAYVSYSLAYAVDVVKAGQPFRFVVDADSGALLEDAVVPIVKDLGDDVEGG